MPRLLEHHDLSRVGLFPLPDVTLLPHQLLPLHVFEPRYRALVEDALQRRRLIGVPRLKPGYEPHYHGNPDVFATFGVGMIVQHRQRRDGCYDVLLRGLGRVHLETELERQPFRTARVTELTDLPTKHNLAPLLAEVQALGERILPLRSAQTVTLVRGALRFASDLAQSEFVMASLLEDAGQRQALLEERDPVRRLTQLLEHLDKLAVAPAKGDESDPTKTWN